MIVTTEAYRRQCNVLTRVAAQTCVCVHTQTASTNQFSTDAAGPLKSNPTQEHLNGAVSRAGIFSHQHLGIKDFLDQIREDCGKKPRWFQSVLFGFCLL